MVWYRTKTIFVLTFSLLFTVSCATWSRTFFASDLNKVSLGEDKSSVILKLGGIYTPVTSTAQDGHQFEVLEFVEKPFYVGRANKAYWTRYWLYFMDRKLVKYERATVANLLEHQKWIQDVMATAATIEAFKGTALAPYHIQQDVNVSGDLDLR